MLRQKSDPYVTYIAFLYFVTNRNNDLTLLRWSSLNLFILSARLSSADVEEDDDEGPASNSLFSSKTELLLALVSPSIAVDLEPSLYRKSTKLRSDLFL